MPWLILAFMAIIFLFSAQNDTVSTAASRSITGRVLVATGQSSDTSMSDMSWQEQKSADTITRKCGHIAEYALLSLLIMIHVSDTKKRAWLWTLPAGILYAASDEFHQYFVPGRSASVKDVLIDTCGIVLGILIALLIKSIMIKRQH